MNYFLLEESPIYEGRYFIVSNFDKMPLLSTNGSYCVLPARILGLPYAQYLRYCRDRGGAELIGKNGLYIVPYFRDKNAVQGLLNELNKRVASIKRNLKFS